MYFSNIFLGAWNLSRVQKRNKYIFYCLEFWWRTSCWGKTSHWYSMSPNAWCWALSDPYSYLLGENSQNHFQWRGCCPFVQQNKPWMWLSFIEHEVSKISTFKKIYFMYITNVRFKFLEPEIWILVFPLQVLCCENSIRKW